MSIVANAYGATQKAGSPTQVAGTGISNVIIAADGLLIDHGHWTGCGATHDTVGAVGLVRHTGVRPGTYNIRTGLCKNTISFKSQQNVKKLISIIITEMLLQVFSGIPQGSVLRHRKFEHATHI